jgi:hypothetical protein
MTNLVILSYGRENEYRRAILAVLSCYAWLSEWARLERVIIFTDNADFLRPYLAGLEVDYKMLTPAKIQSSREPTGYSHRLKAVVINEAFQAYPGDNLLFIDSDTFVFADPKPLLMRISPTVNFMHVLEYPLQERSNGYESGQFLKLIEKETFVTSKGEERYHSSQFSWNSGVLGLSEATAAYMPDIFLLMDEFYVGSNWSISEQLAFALILQTRSKLLPSDSIVHHYWESSKKLAVDALLTTLLTPKFADLVLSDKLNIVSSLTKRLPADIVAYLNMHPEINLREEAIFSLYMKDFKKGYWLASKYILNKPADIKFIKDVLYYTRRLLSW